MLHKLPDGVHPRFQPDDYRDDTAIDSTFPKAKDALAVGAQCRSLMNEFQEQEQRDALGDAREMLTEACTSFVRPMDHNKLVSSP